MESLNGRTNNWIDCQEQLIIVDPRIRPTIQESVTLALRSLAYFLHNEKFIAEISDEKACAVLSSICQLIKSTDKTVLCSLALWCLGIQELKPKVVEASLDLILQSLLYLTDSGTSVSSKALIHQALQGFVKLAQKYSCARIKSSLWAPAIYRRLLSSDKKEREGAEQCMKDLEFMLLCRLKGDLSEVAAVDINETLLPKLEKMIKSKTSVLPAVRAWGCQDALVRNASLVAWEAIVDALLQLPNASGQQNTNINAGVSLSAGELEKPLLVLVPPLKRLKLLMVPFISIMSADKDQAVRLACWHTWHYLAHKLGTAINLPSVADIVVIPIFEAMFRLVKTLWSFSMEPSKNSCTRNLSLSGALRIFLLLVKGVESDGKCAVKPVKQHIDSVHSLLMFLDGVSCQHVETASMGEVLSAMDSLIESLLHLQPLVLSSSFYRISLAPMNFQKKFGEPFLKPDIGVGQEELTEVRTGDLVTPIVYLLHSWVTTASMKELSREERETFKKRLESLVVLAIRGFNVMGNLSGLASVLEFCLSESGRKRKADEANGTSVSNDTKATLGIFCIAPHSCVQLLLSWKTIAEHTAKYLEGSSDMFAVEADINKASLEVNLSGFAKALSDVDLQVVLIAWLKLFDSAGNKGACDGSNSFAEMVAFIAINVLKRTEISNLALLAINRKRRYGSFISTSGTSNGVCGSETETTSNVRNILVLASRVLDLSHDKYIAGQAYWLDSTARVLEELATFAARLNSQQDMLLFVQEFSKPFAKWLKFSESLHANQHNHCSTTVTYSLQKAWQELLYRLRKCHPPLSFDSNLLSLQALALAPAFQHSETSISSCTVSFWEATYGSWNRNGADASRRKSDVPYYTLTGRRCLQVFQELHMDAQNAPSGVSLPLPNMAKGGEDTSFQLGASSLPRSTCNLNTKATGMEQNAVPEKSLKVPRLSLSGHASMEASQAGSDSFHLANSSIFSEIGHCTGEKVKTSAALPMGGSLVVPKCSKAEVPVSSALLSAAAPRRKNRRRGFNPFTKGQLERHMVKGVSEGDGNIMDTPRIVTVNNLLSVEGLNCSKDVGPSDTEKTNSEETRKRFVCELKKLGIRRQRFLRSSGSLRGGKFWRDTSGTVRALQKIRKGAAWLGAENSTTSKDSTDNKMVSVHEVRLVDEPSLVKQKEASAGESKLHVIGVERLPRKRGRPRRLGLANTDAPFHTMQSSNRLASVLNMEDACQQMQTSFEKDVDLGTSKFGNLLQKASPESPFRVQTLNRGLYSNIFSNVARRSDVVNSFASRSHHRKSSCPRRIPMSKDEQNENNQDFQDPHSNLKFKLRMSRRKLECQSGIEFTTPSKILRSGKKLKSKKWGTFSDASKVENKGLRNTLLRKPSHRTIQKASETVELQIGIMQLWQESRFGRNYSGPNEGQTLPHEHGVSSDGNESPSILIMLEKYGELGRRHRLCRRLADLSTSSEWNTMSLDDLECAQELLGNLQVLVGERKRCQLIGQAANMQQLLTYG
ncbi:hypothetical protein GOP47_0030587 [Adiantum capillus-veneris]|nr:hypothetical protein GOP47_0030587 [Adiantum capillus-veneris]